MSESRVGAGLGRLPSVRDRGRQLGARGRLQRHRLHPRPGELGDVAPALRRRLELELRQLDVVRLAGVTLASVQALERLDGRRLARLQVGSLARIARVLGVPAVVLVPALGRAVPEAAAPPEV